ncbi:MAG TPA: SDR family NAD(P)-dependent oxidoreductase, partial [Candidatus Hydrogenedentes bacterium]|nr:SDR family NAD(P)-dependent oxidoreductase [Candidatus Hydrogenedentota bacterium]
MARLQGKRAIVTGAAQGLGESIVERLATEGCSVAIWDINLEKAAATAARLSKSTGQKVIGAKVDVCDANAVRAAMDDTAAQLGGLDIFVSNAGILFSGDSIEFDIEKWRRVIDVNLTGYFICSREAARVMLQSGGGSIIQINSKS